MLPYRILHQDSHAMKSSARSLALLGVLALAGCGGSSVQEGVPANVDFSKPENYMPKAELPKINPKGMAEAAAKGKADAAAAKAETK